MPNISPKANRKWKDCFSPVLYRHRNAIERMFCRRQPEGFPARGHQIWLIGRQLPRRRLHRRYLL
jgi:hypothetical protein